MSNLQALLMVVYCFGFAGYFGWSLVHNSTCRLCGRRVKFFLTAISPLWFVFVVGILLLMAAARFRRFIEGVKRDLRG